MADVSQPQESAEGESPFIIPAQEDTDSGLSSGDESAAILRRVQQQQKTQELQHQQLLRRQQEQAQALDAQREQQHAKEAELLNLQQQQQHKTDATLKPTSSNLFLAEPHSGHTSRQPSLIAEPPPYEPDTTTTPANQDVVGKAGAGKPQQQKFRKKASPKRGVKAVTTTKPTASTTPNGNQNKTIKASFNLNTKPSASPSAKSEPDSPVPLKPDGPQRHHMSGFPVDAFLEFQQMQEQHREQQRYMLLNTSAEDDGETGALEDEKKEDNAAAAGGKPFSPTATREAIAKMEALPDEELIAQMHVARLQQSAHYAQQQMLHQRYLRRRKKPTAQSQQASPSGQQQSTKPGEETKATPSPGAPTTVDAGATTPNKQRSATSLGHSHRVPGSTKSASDYRRPKSASADQGMRAVEARRAVEIAEHDCLFWTNRIKMLKSEVEKTVTRIEIAKRASDVFIGTRDFNVRTQGALAEKEALLKEELETRRARMREQKQANRAACAKSIADVFTAKKMNRDQIREWGDNHERVIQQVRYDEVERNIQRKEAIQQQKMVALLKRVQDRAEKEEVAHKKFEDRIQRIRAIEQEKQKEAVGLIREGVSYMECLRQLKEEQTAVTASITNPILRSKFL